MWRSALSVGLCAVLGYVAAQPASACPYCKADAAGLSAAEAAPADDAGAFPVMLSGGFDFASAYYFRGYQQADHGPILQPYLNIFTTKTIQEGLVVSPYISLFNSTHFAANNRMADMSDVMLGTVTNWNGWLIDTRYAFYNMSPLMRTPVHEIGAKVSYDILTPFDSETLKPFAIRPFVGVYGEFIPEEDLSQLFVNLGVEPNWRIEVNGTKIGLGLPTEWGLGGNGYYFDSDGSNAAAGYFATSLTASISLPLPERFGLWYLNTSIQYLRLIADSVQEAGSFENNVCIGKVGLSFVY